MSKLAQTLTDVTLWINIMIYIEKLSTSALCHVIATIISPILLVCSKIASLALLLIPKLVINPATRHTMLLMSLRNRTFHVASLKATHRVVYTVCTLHRNHPHFQCTFQSKGSGFGSKWGLNFSLVINSRAFAHAVGSTHLSKCYKKHFLAGLVGLQMCAPQVH